MSKYTGLYMENTKAAMYRRNERKKYLKYEELSVNVVLNGIVLPSREDTCSTSEKKLWAIGGVVDVDGTFVESSALGKLWGGGYEYNDEVVDEIEEEVLFLGPFIAHWGHFICDEISRLWYFVKHPGKYKIAYCPWLFGQSVDEWKIYGNYLELLHLIGIENSQLLNITRPTRFKKVIVPDVSFISRQYYTQEYKEIVQAVAKNLKHANIKLYDKIYFTRQNYAEAQNKEYGEKEIADFYKKNGYKILSPEALTVAEQIFYFRNCKNVAMVSGTISHNLIFSAPGLNVVILNKISIDNAYQIIVDHIAEANITYIDAYVNGFPVLFGAGPFWLCVNKNMRAWARENNLQVGIPKVLSLFQGGIWYLKKYRRTYGNNKEMQFWLKSQQDSLRALNEKMRKELEEEQVLDAQK